MLNNTSKTLLDVPIQVGYLIIFGKEATCVLNSVNINASIRPRDTVAGTYNILYVYISDIFFNL